MICRQVLAHAHYYWSSMRRAQGWIFTGKVLETEFFKNSLQSEIEGRLKHSTEMCFYS